MFDVSRGRVGSAVGTISRAIVAAAAVVAVLATPLGQPASVAAAPDEWQTFHGCVVTVGDDFVVIRVHGAGAGPAGLHRFGLTGATTNDTALTGDAYIAVVAWEEDDQWYAASITAEHDDDGSVEVTRHRRG